MSGKFGLIGTITYDRISYESRPSWEGVGGILYQGAVLCSLRKKVFLYTNLGQELVSDVEKIIKKWPKLQRKGINHIPGPGNQVLLHYPESEERVEILRSVVPPLDPIIVIKDLPEFEMLILILNSGYDIELRDWRKIVCSASCPIWIDIHSLPLSKELNVPRKYMPLPDWEKWVERVTFIQANEKEMASILGHPEKEPSKADMLHFGERTFDLGTKAVFITLGKEGVLVMSPEGSKKICSFRVNKVVDTTGCGDVFCAGTAAGLVEGMDPFEAAAFGLKLATKAVAARGIEETYIEVS